MDRKKFERQWSRNEPRIPELRGCYSIVMYPRWFWFLFRDRKWIIGSKMNINIAWGCLAWGKFHVYTSPNNQCQVLDYSIAKFPWSIVRDYVKKIDGELIGRFNVNFPWIGEVGLFWFTMQKVLD